MAVRIPPPPVGTEDKSLWNNWYIAVQNAIANLAGSFKWTLLDFTDSNLTNILTKSHQVLDNLQGGSSTERYHLTSAQASGLTGGVDTTLHYHTTDRARANHTGTQTLATISDVSITATALNSLDDGVDTTLHFHATDRARANHTGTQLLSTISDAGTAASQSGLTVVVTTAKVTSTGANGSMTFTNGVLTAQTQAT